MAQPLNLEVMRGHRSANLRRYYIVTPYNAIATLAIMIVIQHNAILTQPHAIVTPDNAIATSHNGDRRAFSLKIRHCSIKGAGQIMIGFSNALT